MKIVFYQHETITGGGSNGWLRIETEVRLKVKLVSKWLWQVADGRFGNSSFRSSDASQSVVVLGIKEG